MAVSSKDKKKKKRRRAAPLLAPPPIKSRRVARLVTSKFHEITHELESLSKVKESGKEGKEYNKAKVNKRIAELERELTDMGGRKRYQDASKVSTTFFRTSKWVCSVLTRMGRRPKSGEEKLKLFEVGAINTHLLDCMFLDTYAIDLNSRSPRIEQKDFFDVLPRMEFDVVVSAMVINCVPTPAQRLKMILHTHQHLTPNGAFFLILPLLCLRKSLFQTCEKFGEAFMSETGFVLREHKTTIKLAFFCFEKNRSGLGDEEKLFRKWKKHLKFQFR
jgi:25S rRNA (adenine2142-N1)-methyltransferase|eukprot:g7398.t1